MERGLGDGGSAEPLVGFFGVLWQDHCRAGKALQKRYRDATLA